MTKWKETKIGTIPAEWDTKPFEEIIENGSLSYGVVQPGAHRENDSVPILRVNNIRNGRIIPDDVMKIDKEIEAKYKRTRLKGGELLLTVVGSVGEAVIVPNEFKDWNVARAVSVSRVSDGYDKNFIRYCFSTELIKHQMYSHTNDTVQPTLNLSSLKEIVFPIPSLPEQQAIAEVLSSLDNKIDLLHQQNKTLEAVAETIFRQWFVEEAEESWEQMKLGEIAEFHRGISYSGKSLGDRDVGTPMHNLNSVDVSGSYKYEGIKYYLGEVKDRQKLKPGDLLIINTDITQDNRIIGWPLFVPVSFEYSTFTHHLFATTLLTEKISKFYLYFLLRQRDYRDKLANSANGTTVSMLSKEAIGNLIIKLPPATKRIRFERIAEETLNKQALNQKQIGTLTQLRGTLLPKLIGGEVRVGV